MRILMATVIACAALLSGCGGGESKTSGSGASGAAKGNGNGDGGRRAVDVPWQAGRKVVVDVASWDEIQQVIQKHKGKVVVVDFWATWCAPCLAEMPRLVELQREFQDEVVCLSVNFDFTNEVSKTNRTPSKELVAKIRGTVEALDARFQHYVSSTPDELVYERASMSTIPTTLIYDQKGSLAAKVDIDYLNKQWKAAGSKGSKPGDNDLYERGVFPVVKTLLPKE